MSYMFIYAESFNQDLSKWKPNQAVDHGEFVDPSTETNPNFMPPPF